MHVFSANVTYAYFLTECFGNMVWNCQHHFLLPIYSPWYFRLMFPISFKFLSMFYKRIRNILTMVLLPTLNRNYEQPDTLLGRKKMFNFFFVLHCVHKLQRLHICVSYSLLCRAAFKRFIIQKSGAKYLG